jgi:hypothetical protein
MVSEVSTKGFRYAIHSGGLLVLKGLLSGAREELAILKGISDFVRQEKIEKLSVHAAGLALRQEGVELWIFFVKEALQGVMIEYLPCQLETCLKHDDIYLAAHSRSSFSE